VWLLVGWSCGLGCCDGTTLGPSRVSLCYSTTLGTNIFLPRFVVSFSPRAYVSRSFGDFFPLQFWKFFPDVFGTDVARRRERMRRWILTASWTSMV
jgi:hypothetical protein